MEPGAAWLATAAQENMAAQAADGRAGGQYAEDMAHQGGVGEGYTWTQDPEEIEINVPLPEAVPPLPRTQPLGCPLRHVGAVGYQVERGQGRLQA